MKTGENHVLDTYVMHNFLAVKQRLKVVLADSQPAAPSQAPREVRRVVAQSRRVQSVAPEDW